MNKPKPLKPFKTIEEEATFWDTHDVSVLADNPHMPLAELPTLEKEKEASITIRVQKSIKEKLTSIAHQKGINPSTLSRMWIIERIQNEHTSKTL